MDSSQSPAQDASGDLRVMYLPCTILAFLQGLLQVTYLVAKKKILTTKQNKGTLACFLNDLHTAELFKYVGGGKSMAGYFLSAVPARDTSQIFPPEQEAPTPLTESFLHL